MAKITTITNPLTGQPAQVDQLDHTAQQIDDAVTRAIGYGLGGNVVEAPVNSDGYADANLITKTGFYRAMANTPLGGWHYIIHNEYSSSTAFQIAFHGNSAVLAIRRKLNSVWKVWEFINPPMKFGEEYRTTERYNNNKPVYVRCINCGTLTVTAPEVKKTELIIDNIDCVISCTATDSTSAGWSFPSDMIGYGMTNQSTISCSARWSVNADNRGILQVLTAKTFPANWTSNIVAMVKYTKSVN